MNGIEVLNFEPITVNSFQGACPNCRYGVTVNYRCPFCLVENAISTQAWNPFPYLRATHEHFSQNPKSETDRVIPHLANDALSGNHAAFHILGDALQESSDPEWYHTPVNHGLSWLPWEGKTGSPRFLVSPPRLTRHILHPRRYLYNEPGVYSVYEAHPHFSNRVAADYQGRPIPYWRADKQIHFQDPRYTGPGNYAPLHPTLEELRDRGFALKDPIIHKDHYWGRNEPTFLTDKERHLISSPTVADARSYARMVSIARPHNIRMRPIGNGYHLISEYSARKLAGVLPRRGTQVKVHHQGQEHWLGRTMYNDEPRWAISTDVGQHIGPSILESRFPGSLRRDES